MDDSSDKETDCEKAMAGKLIFKLDPDRTRDRAALIYGIRHHIGLLQSYVVRTVCTGFNAGLYPDLLRARNARLIMSGIMPSVEEMGAFDQDEGVRDESLTRPYCIWHPEFASEEFYREVATKYPKLRYQVGRACAAAGYNTLYHELDLLPDISIAEEAREANTESSLSIYNTIMAAPARYVIMDDYTRSVNLNASPANTPPAYLEGETVVRRLIGVFRHYTYFIKWFDGYNGLRHLPSITEDWGIRPDNYYPPSSEADPVLTEQELELLYTPLPRDLPTLNKDLLTALAAHHGDIDRYSRLANRKLLASETEVDAIVRGIHWNPLFARFWVMQFEQKTNLVVRLLEEDTISVKKAIAARRIMCNDWQDFEHGWNPDVPHPFLIWWPHKPEPGTLIELYYKVPEMMEACVVAAIVSDYHWIFDQIKIDPPTQGMFLAATQSVNTHYLEAILPRLEELGLDWDVTDSLKTPDYTWIMQEPERATHNYLIPKIDLHDCVQYSRHDCYEMRQEAYVDITYTRILWSKETLEAKREEERRREEEWRIWSSRRIEGESKKCCSDASS